MFINFYPKKVPTNSGWWTESNLFASWHGAAGDARWLFGTKPACNFARDTFRFQAQLGSQLYPQVPIASFAEALSLIHI